MFYETDLKTYVRVPPMSFSENRKEAILKELNKKFEGFISQEVGAVVAVSSIKNVGEGIIIPGDGAAYYETTFTVFTFKPELQEIVVGRITDITEFGAFIEMGPIDGMIHVSQTMDDYVSYNKSGTLTGKQSKHVLRANDICRARIIAVSYKEQHNPKIGLTMRQHRLGSLHYIEEELKEQGKKKK